MELKDVIKYKNQICKEHDCQKCPFSTLPSLQDFINCNLIIYYHPDETEEIILKWLEAKKIKYSPLSDQWKSVNKNPPEEEGVYLIQTDSDYMTLCRWTNASPIYTNEITDWHWNIFDIPQYSKIVAWQEKPELYIKNKGENDG